MKKQNGFIQIPILITIIVGVLVFGSAGYVGIKQYGNYQNQKTKDAEIARQDQKKKEAEEKTRNAELEKLKKEVENLKNKKPPSPQIIIKEIEQKTGSDIASIIKAWRPKIGLIECKWYTKNGSLLIDAFGSGTLTKASIDGKSSLLTNRHVVSGEDSTYPSWCSVSFPDDKDVYIINSYLVNGVLTTEDITWTSEFDLGNVYITNLTPHRKSVAGIRGESDFLQCRIKASIGDQVVILGYPAIGSTTDITATEGIISGYENGYYVTSAKVESGNSGGAAILVKDNCYLGIPSYAVSGEVESLARILDLNYVERWYTGK